ncbi:Uncharacterized protein PRO82_000865 [Candidatus Protochlamydia amoebophila]|nr:Uncharacterized protein [Candidatus Protochlamydia amoebophila]
MNFRFSVFSDICQIFLRMCKWLEIYLLNHTAIKHNWLIINNLYNI